MKNKLGFTLDEQEAINSIVREYGLFDYSKKLNTVCFFGNENRKHFLAKANLCYILKKNKIPFITEFSIKGKENKKNIPDVLVLKPLVAFEILNSETTQQFSDKIHKAANGLLLIPISADKALFLNNLSEYL